MSLRAIYVVAGPNGAGKTTLARILFPGIDVINPDAIAATLSPGAPERVAVGAGRLALSGIDRRMSTGESFGVETTLAGRWIFRLFQQARQAGYGIELVYVGLELERLAIQRVRLRKAQGGHDVPEDDIRRRYHASLKHLHAALLLADHTMLYDNSSAEGPRVFAEIQGSAVVALEPDPPRWFEVAMGPNVRLGDDLRERRT